jgi:hypothetical protein
MPGFTQIPNDVFDDGLWTSEKFTKGQAHSDLYRLAQFQPGIVQKRGIIIELEPGQIGWSQTELSKRWTRSLGWVRRLLGHLEMRGHIALQKTNVSSTIILLHWVKNDNAKGTANGKQTVQQKDSKGYTNNTVNTVNTENTVNIENTPSEGVEFENSINILWNEWNYNAESLPTEYQKNIIIGALKYNSDVDGFWLPSLQKRRTINEGGGFTHNSMKYWFESGFSEMEMSKKKLVFSKTKTNLYIAYCSKCGKKDFPNDYQLKRGSECCRIEYVPDKPIKQSV